MFWIVGEGVQRTLDLYFFLKMGTEPQVGRLGGMGTQTGLVTVTERFLVRWRMPSVCLGFTGHCEAVWKCSNWVVMHSKENDRDFGCLCSPTAHFISSSYANDRETQSLLLELGMPCSRPVQALGGLENLGIGWTRQHSLQSADTLRSGWPITKK